MKIVIVGGGTAGWMAAAYFAKYFGSENITLVESSIIPKIGVGESVTPHVRDFLHEIGFSENDWMEKTGAIHKYANKFINWNGNNDYQYFSFNYTVPTSNFYKDISGNRFKEDFSNTTHQSRSIDILSDLCLNGIYNRFDQYFNPQFHYMEKNVSPYKNNEALLNQAYSYAHHINTELAGKYIKDNLAMNVDNIIADVKDVQVSGDIIDYIILDNGNKLTADLFLDCSGFHKVLIKKLGWKEKVYETPIDSAWVCQTDYSDPNVEMVNYTQSIAEPYGWRFKIGLYHRMGNGYCYSSKYIDDQSAKNHFMKQISNPKSSPRLIKWTPSRLKTFGAGNCAAIGLSCGFVEPLEANALYTIITSIRRLGQLLLNSENLDFSEYNEKMAYTIDDIADFIFVHYTLSSRRDTKFWRDMSELGVLKNHRNLVIEKIYEEKNTMHGASIGYTMFPDYMWTQLAIHWGITFDSRMKIDSKDQEIAKMHFEFNESKHRYISDTCDNNYEWLKNYIFNNVSSDKWRIH